MIPDPECRVPAVTSDVMAHRIAWHMGWHMAGLMLFRVVVTRCMGMGIGMEHEHACGSV